MSVNSPQKLDQTIQVEVADGHSPASCRRDTTDKRCALTIRIRIAGAASRLRLCPGAVTEMASALSSNPARMCLRRGSCNPIFSGA